MPGAGFPGNDAPYWRYKETQIANPGAGNLAMLPFTILSEVVSVVFRLTNSAVAGTRRAQVILTDSTGNWHRGAGMHTLIQPPGATWVYQAYLDYGVPPMDSGIGFLHMPLSANMIALPGDQLVISPFGFQAGDALTNIFVVTREFLDNADNTNIR